jgi:hypothetical protein
MHRNANATLRPTEFASLRRVYNGLVKTVPSPHRDLFITMGLVTADDFGGLVVTEVGQRRLQCEGRTPWRGTPASNLFDRPKETTPKRRIRQRT